MILKLRSTTVFLQPETMFFCSGVTVYLSLNPPFAPLLNNIYRYVHRLVSGFRLQMQTFVEQSKFKVTETVSRQVRVCSRSSRQQIRARFIEMSGQAGLPGKDGQLAAEER